jgi:myosin heavy subunit
MQEEISINLKQRDAIVTHQHICDCYKAAAVSLMDMSKSLKHMRDDKLYTELGYESFGDYVEHNEDYSFKERQAYTYISCYEKLGEAFLQSNANLGITKLELLTKLDTFDRAEIAEDNDLAGMTVDEVKQLIADKQALGEQLSLFQQAEKENQNAQQELDKAIKEIEQLKSRLEDAQENYDDQSTKDAERIKELQLELDELKNKPVEVAVQQPSKEEIDKIKETERKKLEKAKKKEIDELKAEQEKQIAKLKEEHELALKTERDQAAMREAQLEKKVKSNNSEEAVIALKIIFADTQKSVNAFLDKINDLQSDEAKKKFKSGAREWLSLIVEKLGD